MLRHNSKAATVSRSQQQHRASFPCGHPRSADHNQRMTRLARGFLLALYQALFGYVVLGVITTLLTTVLCTGMYVHTGTRTLTVCTQCR